MPQHNHAHPTRRRSPRRSKPLPEPALQDVVQLFQAMADLSRAKIIYALTDGEWSVNELAEHVGVSATAVSHHLRRLRDAHLVNFHRHGNQVHYSIEDVHVAALFEEALNHIEHAQH
jgi:DNA-binding transcriptional ArsR family regulator